MASPDYKNSSPEQAYEDLKARIKLYETQYEPLCLTKDNQVHFLKVVDTGKRFVVNRVEGENIITVNHLSFFQRPIIHGKFITNKGYFSIIFLKKFEQLWPERICAHMVMIYMAICLECRSGY